MKRDILLVVYGGRGSANKNKEYYEAGRGKNILKSVEDLIDTAKYLVEKGLALVLMI